MELRQLEYFIVTCNKGSFNRAAECLYTTQPNVSKVIGNLEKELGQKLFARNSRGLELTPYGRTIQEYARNILQNVDMINMGKVQTKEVQFAVSTYPSNMISRYIADFYQEMGLNHAIEHLIGNVEEICDNVSKGLTEIGILYIAKKQLQPFLHILSHKKLKYTELTLKELCLYVGKNHPKYDSDRIQFSELFNLKYVGGIRDYFSMEHHLNRISLGAISTNKLNYVFYTNSHQSVISMIENTDAVSIGIDFIYEDYRIPSIKPLKIEGCEVILSFGYVQREDDEMSSQAKLFLEKLVKML